MFRGKMLAFLKHAYDRRQLRFPGSLADLAQPRPFHSLLNLLRHKKWVVYAKPPFGGPEQVLKYLAPGTPTASPSPTEDSSVSKTARCAFAGGIPDTTTASAS
jgi:hypothetical protein